MPPKPVYSYPLIQRINPAIRGLSGSPLGADGTQAPGWGTSPGTRSGVRARWDPNPALGLAMRLMERPAVGRAERSGGGRWRGRGLSLARVRA